MDRRELLKNAGKMLLSLPFLIQQDTLRLDQENPEDEWIESDSDERFWEAGQGYQFPENEEEWVISEGHGWDCEFIKVKVGSTEKYIRLVS